ncbi:MAG: PIN domain-containing protein [Bryobacteraceae bacterium]|nr:PIN domain-containing protein [Bryobacteraceae bacterium]
MTEKHFVDTNVLIYAFDGGAGEKHERSAQLLEDLWNRRCGCLSIQVLQEFYVNAAKKLKMTSGEAFLHIQRFAKWQVHRPDPEDILQAIRMQQAHSVSFWDAMVVRSAQQLQCSILWSEDLNAGQNYGGVLVRNPFLPAHRRRPKAPGQPR